MFIDPRQDRQRLQQAIVGNLFDSLQGEPAARVSGTTASSRTYFGAGLAPQKFTRPPNGPNDPIDMSRAPIQAGMARRALNRTRGWA